MPAKKQSKAVVTCPSCGHRQQEPPSAYSTVCKKCRQYFRVQEVLRPSAPVEEERKDLREVHCFKCGTALQVPTAAQSTMCKRCSSHVDLRDYHITSTVSRNFKTKGRFVIDESGYLLNSDTTAGDVVLKGRIIGRLTAENSLEIHQSAEIKGSFRAGCLVIPSGTRFRWPQPIEGRDADVSGELVADVRAEGTVTLRAGARFFGDVEARNLVVESGAIFVGNAKIRPAQAQAAETPVVAQISG